MNIRKKAEDIFQKETFYKLGKWHGSALFVNNNCDTDQNRADFDVCNKEI